MMLMAAAGQVRVVKCSEVKRHMVNADQGVMLGVTECGTYTVNEVFRSGGKLKYWTVRTGMNEDVALERYEQDIAQFGAYETVGLDLEEW